MASPSKDGDLEANEETELLGNGSNSLSPPSNEDAEIWQEMDQPWPATFERSISILSSPLINAAEADLFTKSPKPGNTPFAARRRMRYETPQGTILPPLVRHKSIDDKRNITEGTAVLDFQATKESLRASSASTSVTTKMTPLADTQKKQEKKAQEAAEYRARILKQQQAKQKDKGDMSPSFRKEKAAIKASKQGRMEREDRQRNFDGKATSAQCAFNLANILMGVGLLGLPYSCAKAGVVGGTCALLVFGFICWKTSILIGRELNGDPRPSSYFDDSPWKTPLQPGSVPEARMRKPISSFPDIAREAFGYWGALILAIVLYFELFSCVCIFLVSIGDHLHTLFPHISAASFMIGCCFVSAIPIVLLRTAKLLSYLSMVGTISTVCVVGAVIMAFFFEGDLTAVAASRLDNPPPPPYHDLFHADGLAIAFGLVAYCFSGHAIIPSIYNSMQKPQEFEKVVDWSFLVVMGCCLAVGVSGYAMFGNLVFDQVTISLEQNSSATLAMTILTYLMVLTAFSKLTLTMFPLAIGMEEIVAPFLTSDRSMVIASGLIKMILLVMSLLVAIYVPSFSFLCSMVGMICTMIVSVIFPAAAYLKLFGSQLSTLERLLYLSIVIAGFVMAIVGTIFGL